MSRNAQITEYGWTAVPLDPQKWSSMGTNKPPVPHLVKDASLPNTPVVKAATEYAQAELPIQTINHSMRVYHYGLAIARQRFPDWKFSNETWLLTCLFHDIGTADRVTREVFMSFDLYGGCVALDVLRQKGAPAAQAESVAEAVMRHQHPSEVGEIHTVGLLIQLATQFDNMGFHKDYVHQDTVRDVTRHYPRREWSHCFSTKLREEIGLKPWCHSTVPGEMFPYNVEHNGLMEPYDKLY